MRPVAPPAGGGGAWDAAGNASSRSNAAPASGIESLRTEIMEGVPSRDGTRIPGRLRTVPRCQANPLLSTDFKPKSFARLGLIMRDRNTQRAASAESVEEQPTTMAAPKGRIEHGAERPAKFNIVR